MLRDDENRLRAMLCVGGNPIAALPDQKRTIKALERLDLYVQVDPWMSRSARYADYVLAPTMPLETAANTQVLDMLTGWTGYGLGQPYANSTPAIVRPPPDVRDDWQLLYGIAKRLGFDGQLTAKDGTVFSIGDDTSTEALLALMAQGSRVSLSSVKEVPSGGVFAEPGAMVLEKDEHWPGRFDVAHPRDVASAINLADRQH